MREKAFSLAVALVSLWTTSAIAQSSADVERIVVELAPAGHPATGFVRDYATLLEKRLGQIKEFSTFLDSKQPILCNLLCQKQITAGFFRSEVLGPGELVHYALSSTCYGLMQDSRHRGKALEDLEAVLGKHNWYRQSPGLSDIDKLNIRTAVGDALKDYLGNTNISNSSKNREIGKRFGRVRQLWQGSYPGGPSVTNVLPRRWVASREELAAETCRNSIYDRSLSK